MIPPTSASCNFEVMSAWTVRAGHEQKTRCSSLENGYFLRLYLHSSPEFTADGAARASRPAYPGCAVLSFASARLRRTPESSCPFREARQARARMAARLEGGKGCREGLDSSLEGGKSREGWREA